MMTPTGLRLKQFNLFLKNHNQLVQFQDLSVACPVCERKFKHKNTCTVHIKTNHLGWTKRKLFECPDCFRSFDNKRAVDCHR